jgi:hypothetical protein
VYRATGQEARHHVLYVGLAQPVNDPVQARTARVGVHSIAIVRLAGAPGITELTDHKASVRTEINPFE